MAEGTRRRSARLLALQEPKNQKKPFGINMLDNEKEAKNPQQVDPSNNESSTNMIIDHILDVLQVNDTKELFSMPNNIQINDYSEAVNNPGDFATLRQKLKDGMYQTLEQFENDVYKVFHKAIISNPQDSLRMKEAAYQKESAKNLFQSLKNNRGHILLHISAWHQKYFGYTKKNSNYRRTQSVSSISKKAPNFSAIPSSMPTNRIESVEGSEFCEEQQTYANNTMSNFSIPVSMHPTPIVYNNNTPGFMQNLMHYGKDTHSQPFTSLEQQPYMEHGQGAGFSLPFNWGPHNQMGNANFLSATSSNLFNYFSFPHNGANFISNNAEANWYFPLMNTMHFWNPHFLGSAAGGTGSASFSTMESSSLPSMGANSMPGSNVLYGPNGNLDNDSLLMLLSSVGTPESLGKGKNISGSSSSQAIEPNMISDKGKSILPYPSQAIEPKSNFDAVFNLGVEGSGTMRRVEPSYAGANLVSNEAQCSKGRETAQSSSIDDSVPCPFGSTGIEFNPSSTTNETPYTNPGSSSAATSTDPDEPRTLNLFEGPK